MNFADEIMLNIFKYAAPRELALMPTLSRRFWALSKEDILRVDKVCQFLAKLNVTFFFKYLFPSYQTAGDMVYPDPLIKETIYDWPGSCSCPLMGVHTWVSKEEKEVEKRVCALSAYQHLLSEQPWGYHHLQLSPVEIDLEDSFDREYLFLKTKKILQMRLEFSQRELELIFTSHANKIWWRH
jgi:hypothetical protein